MRIEIQHQLELSIGDGMEVLFPRYAIPKLRCDFWCVNRGGENSTRNFCLLAKACCDLIILSRNSGLK